MVCPPAATINSDRHRRDTVVKIIDSWSLPAASPGTDRSLDIIRYGTKGARPKVYIQAGLHADEAPSFVVLHQLLQMLDRANEHEQIQGEIIVVPVANPIGLSQWRDEWLNGRFDFCNSINYNRNHLDLADQVAELVESQLGTDVRQNVTLIRDCTAQVLTSVTPGDEAGHLKHKLLSLSHDADIVLDLHCDLQASMHLYMGDAHWPEGIDLAAFLGAEAILLAADSGGTPFDEANSRIWWELAKRYPTYPIPPACFAVTVELRGIADTDRRTVEEDAHNLFCFLQNRHSITTPAPEVPTLSAQATPLTGVDYIKAQTPGIITYHKQVGEFVEKGEIIAEILNPLTRHREGQIVPVASGATGLLFSRNVDRFARPGRIIAKVAGAEPLRDDSDNLLTL